MARIIQFICDNQACGAVRRSENHWWKVVTLNGQVSVRPFDPEAELLPFERIACGEPCALLMVTAGMAWLSRDLADAQADGQK